MTNADKTIVILNLVIMVMLSGCVGYALRVAVEQTKALRELTKHDVKNNKDKMH